MFTAKLTTRTGPVLAEIRAKSWAGVMRAAVFYWQKCVEAVSIANSRVDRVRTRNTSRGSAGSTYATYPNPAVRPNPPHLRTGFGRSNLAYELDQAKGEARIGVRKNAFYMAVLQAHGWDWLLSTLRKHWRTIKGLAESS